MVLSSQSLGAVILALALSALAAGGVSASPDGPAMDKARACHKDAFKNFVRDDGSPFSNRGKCTSYVARGGMLRTFAANERWSLACARNPGGAQASTDQDPLEWVCFPLQVGPEVPTLSQETHDELQRICIEAGGTHRAARALREPATNYARIDCLF